MKKASIETARRLLGMSPHDWNALYNAIGVDPSEIRNMLKDVATTPPYTPPKHPLDAALTDSTERPCPDPWDEPIPYRLTPKGLRGSIVGRARP